MHIPDGYLSPKTCAVFYAAMAPLWWLAARRLEKEFKTRRMPLIALFAAFVFVIMMFNIPVPGGSSGHMMGSAAAAIVLGPWAALVSVTIALTLQALLFGDGGITALGANAFNMAFLACLSGYFVFRIVSAGSPGGARVAAAALFAGFVSTNVAAIAVAIELGIQPLVASGADGRPLYSPFPLDVALPAMALPHLLFFGPVEAVGTMLVVSYARRTGAAEIEGMKGGARSLWIALAVLIALTPIGLLATGTPWGEWGAQEAGRLSGYVPEGMERLEGLWKGLLPDYSLPGAEGGRAVFLYVLSAAAGSAAVVLMAYIWGRLWRR